METSRLVAPLWVFTTTAERGVAGTREVVSTSGLWKPPTARASGVSVQDLPPHLFWSGSLRQSLTLSSEGLIVVVAAQTWAAVREPNDEPWRA